MSEYIPFFRVDSFFFLALNDIDLYGYYFILFNYSNLHIRLLITIQSLLLLSNPPIADYPRPHHVGESDPS